MSDERARELWDAARIAIGGGPPQRGDGAVSPVARYLDPARHGRETLALRRLPHAVGSELAASTTSARPAVHTCRFWSGATVYLAGC